MTTYDLFLPADLPMDDPDALTACVMAAGHPHTEFINHHLTRHVLMDGMLHIQGLGESPAHEQCIRQLEYWGDALVKAQAGAWC